MKNKSIFDLYPNLEVYYETSDGTKFFSEYDAKRHAMTLRDKRIKKVERPAPAPEKATGTKTGKNKEPEARKPESEKEETAKNEEKPEKEPEARKPANKNTKSK